MSLMFVAHRPLKEIYKAMAHKIEAFIGRQSGLEEASARFQAAHLISLSQGFALLPLNDSFLQEVIPQLKDGHQTAYPQFSALTPPLADLGVELSSHTPLAYVETEYFGGGTQGSVVWNQGQVVFGPLRTGEPEEWEFSPVVSTPLHSGAINQALRYLGVTSANFSDEFAALQLGKYRSNDEWLETIKP